MSPQSRFPSSAAFAIVIASLAWTTRARAVPPQPDPDVAPAAAPAAPAAPPTTTTTTPPPDPTAAEPPPSTTTPPEPPTTPGATATDQRFAPPPNLERNPIDILPGDVVYPPKRDPDKPVKPVKWHPEWRRFSTADWVITGAATAITLTAAILPPQPRHVYGGVLFDEDARRVLRHPTVEGRYVARDASDVILSLEATWPLFVDALITTWWYRGSPDAAGQMALIDAQALAIVTAVQGATNTIASRERPYGRICGTEEQPDQTIGCEGNVRFRSFFSGHSAFAFMSAGLICVHHQKLDLLGSTGDAISCVAGYAGAAATATLRVVGDVHYVSDVTVGALFGTAVGLLVPLWHYRHVNKAPQGKNGHGVDVTVIPVGAGLGLGGTF